MIIYYFNKITNADKFCLQASYTRGVIFKKSNCPDMQLGYKIQRKRKNRFILLMVHLYFKLSKQIVRRF